MKTNTISVRSRGLARFLALSMAAGISLAGGAVTSSVQAESVAQAGGLQSSSLVFNGIEDVKNLRYASIEFYNVSEDGKQIDLVLNQWLTGSSGWAQDEDVPNSGNVYLIFNNPTFYNAIESIVTNPEKRESQQGQFTKVEEDGGKSYALSIRKGEINYAAIGQNVSTNIRIQLTQSLTELGLQDTPIFYESFWTTDEGVIPSGSVDQSYFVGNRTSLNALEENAINENFIGSDDRAMNKVLFDRLDDGTYVINSVRTWYPVENYKQSLSGGVAYVEENIPTFLLPYLEETVEIAGSDRNGNIHEDTVPAVVPLHEDGHVDLADHPDYNVAGAEDEDDAKDLGNENIFSAGNDGSPAGAALGQSRSLTIRYRLKPDVDITEFTKALDTYMKENGPLVFESWFEKGTPEDTEETPSQYILRSYATGSLNGLDSDGDGLLDIVEREYGTNPGEEDTDNDGYTDAEEVLRGSDPTKTDSIPYAETTISPQQLEVVQGQTVETPVVITTPDDQVQVSVDEATLPAGVTYDAATKTLNGTPTVTNEDFGDAESKTFSVPVTIENPDGTKQVESVVYTVLRDTDQDGEPDVTDTDDDNDGVPDAEDEAPKDSTLPEQPDEPEGPTETTISQTAQTVVNGQPITEVVITPAAGHTVSVAETDLPEGLSFNAETNTLSGTPEVSDDVFGDASTKEFDIPVTITNADGESETKTVTVTVQRDRDGDGVPDVTDPDIDGDNVPNEEDIDPMDPSKGAAEDPGTDPTPQETTISNRQQIVQSGEAISPVVISPAEPNAQVTVGDLPEGLSFDPNTNTVSGTVEETLGLGDGETKTIDIPVVITKADGSEEEHTITVTVQRDFDTDGDVDVVDGDDDNDGTNDGDDFDPLQDSLGAGDDLLTGSQIIVDGTPMEDVVLLPKEEGNVSLNVGDLPDGVTFDSETNTIQGTPTLGNDAFDAVGEDTLTFKVNPVVEREDGSVEELGTLVLTVQRDTDGDGEPDVTDSDDDNDGVNDVDDLNPKDADVLGVEEEEKPDEPQPPTTSTIANGTQIVVNGNEISDIVITPVSEEAEVAVDEAALPNGLTFDAETLTISGTPEVSDEVFGAASTKEFDIPVTITTPDGEENKVVTVTVQRDRDGDGIPDVADDDIDGDGVLNGDDIDPLDATKGGVDTDGDGTPDVTDTDDDNDGVLDADDIAPLDKTQGAQTVVNEKPMTPIVVKPAKDGATVAIDAADLPAELVFDEESQTLSGTPKVSAEEFGEAETVTLSIPVTVKNPDGTEEEKTLALTVQRDTDGDGTPDVTDTDDDGDGTPDAEDSHPKDATKGGVDTDGDGTPDVTDTDDDNDGVLDADDIAPLDKTQGAQTVVNEKPMTPIVVKPAKDGATVAIDAADLPAELVFDEESQTLSGTPKVSAEEFGEAETVTLSIPVTVKNPDGTEEEKTLALTVQRDTDGDGIPDVTDTDDDGDGTPDAEDSHPKDATKGGVDTDGDGTPDVTDTDDDNDGVLDADDIAPLDKTQGAQTVVNEKPMTPIVLKPATDGATVAIDAADLPAELVFDEESQTLSGTPKVSAEEFGEAETVTLSIPVTVKNPDGTEEEKTLALTVQRDTDGDGIPDVTDTDDDGDGTPDVEDSHPKDATKGGVDKKPSKAPKTGDVTLLPLVASAMASAAALYVSKRKRK